MRYTQLSSFTLSAGVHSTLVTTTMKNSAGMNAPLFVCLAFRNAAASPAANTISARAI
ncbi:Uncharacterised protein [Mycobacteroides abscessus subsp. abscessus]|nr:Uncharacterised protein [Mycobacteroides abscessus subsp. abscessus]